MSELPGVLTACGRWLPIISAGPSSFMRGGDGCRRVSKASIGGANTGTAAFAMFKYHKDNLRLLQGAHPPAIESCRLNELGYWRAASRILNSKREKMSEKPPKAAKKKKSRSLKPRIVIIAFVLATGFAISVALIV